MLYLGLSAIEPPCCLSLIPQTVRHNGGGLCKRVGSSDDQTRILRGTYWVKSIQSEKIQWNANKALVEGVGFEPTKAYASGFTVRPL